MTYPFDFAALVPHWRDFAEDVWPMLQLSAVSTVLGFVGGALCATARADGPPWLKRGIGAYVEVIRNTPLLVQIFLVCFGIAVFGLRVDANLAAMLALVVDVAACSRRPHPVRHFPQLRDLHHGVPARNGPGSTGPPPIGNRPASARGG